jgi:PIN domain nuclease of toxin-antitoxin system
LLQKQLEVDKNLGNLNNLVNKVTEIQEELLNKGLTTQEIEAKLKNFLTQVKN